MLANIDWYTEPLTLVLFGTLVLWFEINRRRRGEGEEEGGGKGGGGEVT